MKSRLLLAGVALFALGTGAFAADFPLPVEQAPVEIAAPAMNWTGFYVGAHLGYVFGNVDVDVANPFGLDPFADPDLDGITAGVHAGVDYQFQNGVVLGALLSVPVFNSDDDVAVTFGGIAAGTVEAEMNWAVAAVVRLGYAVDRFLPYVFAGGVVGQGEATYDIPAFGTFDDTEMHTGFTAGAGVDFALTENWTVGARYAYANLSEETYLEDDTLFPPSVDSDVHSLALTVDFRF